MIDCRSVAVPAGSSIRKRTARGGVAEIGAIVEHGQGPIGEQAGVVLGAEGVRAGILFHRQALGRGRAAQLPDDLAGALSIL